MHRDQLHIDAAIARELIVERFPQFADEPVEPLGGLGTVNAVFRIGTGAAARFPLRPADPVEAAQVLRAEAAAMAAFAACAPVPAPRPLGLGRPSSRYPMPWSVQSWIDGAVATPAGLAGSTAFALDIADLVAALRAVGTNGRGFDGRGRGGRLADHDAWLDVCFRNSEGILDVPRLRRLWVRLRALPEPGAVAMSHRDLIPANLLVRGERLAGVLDTGSFGPSDPALDLVAAWHLFDGDGREAMWARIGAGTVEWRRGAAWAFQQAMGLVWY